MLNKIWIVLTHTDSCTWIEGNTFFYNKSDAEAHKNYLDEMVCRDRIYGYTYEVVALTGMPVNKEGGYCESSL